MNRIEDQANYFKNIPLRNRDVIAVVHLEDKADEPFWDNQLQNVKSGKYHYIHYSRSPKGSDARGCEQCLRYLPYCNNRFFICIDSDFRHLLREDSLQTSQYFAQTYTYSWENHHCEAKCLQHRCMKCGNGFDFDFESFLTQLSEIVYKPLLHMLYALETGNHEVWNLSKFNSCIPLQPSRNNLMENGAGYLNKLKQNFEEITNGMEFPEGYRIEELTPANAYLHIQGHQLYKLVTHIGTLLCSRKRIAFKTDILDSAFQTAGYSEIDHLQSDLQRILESN